MPRTRRLLVVSGRADEGPGLQLLLARGSGYRVQCDVEPWPRRALRRLCHEPFDAAVVDAEALHGDGTGSLARFNQLAPDVPMLVLTSRPDARLAELAIRMGAQDVLLRSELTAPRLALALACAIERTRRLAELRELSLSDPLTGLCNRRGFLLLAESHARLLRRTRGQSLLLFGDVDDLKGINDRGGHAAGDRALKACAHALRSSLRDSDIVARYGGDEFTALAHDVSEGATMVLLPRIAATLEDLTRTLRIPVPVSMSLGAASFERGGLSLEEILERADRAMYVEKRRRAVAASMDGDEPPARGADPGGPGTT